MLRNQSSKTASMEGKKGQIKTYQCGRITLEAADQFLKREARATCKIKQKQHYT